VNSYPRRLIAGTASAHGATFVVTRNVDAFGRIGGLRVAN
jgi:predicted nucleic acid-binding protein